MKNICKLVCTLQLLSLFLLSACETKSKISESKNDRSDSILTQYLHRADSFPYFDTSDLNYRLLKAYSSGDTGYLSAKFYELSKSIENIPKELLVDSCITHLSCYDGDFEEAYLFIYEPSFSKYKTNITVVKEIDSAKITFRIYKPKASDETCKLIKEETKPLALSEWETIIKSLKYADFWGMNGSNNQIGLDGSSLVVHGYQKNAQSSEVKERKVYRWNSELTAIGDVYKLSSRLSGLDQFLAK